MATQIPPHNKWPPLPYSPIYKHWVTATKVKKSGKSRTCLSRLSETPSMWGNAMQPCSQDMKSVQFLDYHLLLFTYWERLLNLAQKKVSVIPYLVSKTHRQAIMLIQLLHTALNTPRSWVFCSLCPTLPVFVLIYILILIHTIYESVRPCEEVNNHNHYKFILKTGNKKHKTT
jgi:hypothetical protein